MLGEAIRRGRKRLGLTLSELSEKAGLTTSFLSMVERNQSDLSVSSLRKIASALGVPIFHFLLDETDENHVVKREKRKRLKLPGSKVTYELLVPHLKGKMEMILGRLEPFAASRDEPSSHPCEECTYVLQGTLEVDLGGKIYTVRAGDSIYFDGSIPHVFRNSGAEDVVFISASTPPVF